MADFSPIWSIELGEQGPFTQLYKNRTISYSIQSPTIRVERFQGCDGKPGKFQISTAFVLSCHLDHPPEHRVRERKYSFEEVTLKVIRLGKESLFQDPSGQQKETFTVTSTSGGSIAAGISAGASGTVPTGLVSVNLVRDRQITISQQTNQWQLETYTSANGLSQVWKWNQNSALMGPQYQQDTVDWSILVKRSNVDEVKWGLEKGNISFEFDLEIVISEVRPQILRIFHSKPHHWPTSFDIKPKDLPEKVLEQEELLAQLGQWIPKKQTPLIQDIRDRLLSGEMGSAGCHTILPTQLPKLRDDPLYRNTPYFHSGLVVSDGPGNLVFQDMP